MCGRNINAAQIIGQLIYRLQWRRQKGHDDEMRWTESQLAREALGGQRGNWAVGQAVKALERDGFIKVQSHAARRMLKNGKPDRARFITVEIDKIREWREANGFPISTMKEDEIFRAVMIGSPLWESGTETQAGNGYQQVQKEVIGEDSPSLVSGPPAKSSTKMKPLNPLERKAETGESGVSEIPGFAGGPFFDSIFGVEESDKASQREARCSEGAAETRSDHADVALAAPEAPRGARSAKKPARMEVWTVGAPESPEAYLREFSKSPWCLMVCGLMRIEDVTQAEARYLLGRIMNGKFTVNHLLYVQFVLSARKTPMNLRAVCDAIDLAFTPASDGYNPGIDNLKDAVGELLDAEGVIMDSSRSGYLTGVRIVMQGTRNRRAESQENREKILTRATEWSSISRENGPRGRYLQTASLSKEQFWNLTA